MKLLISILCGLLFAILAQLYRLEASLTDYRPQRHEHLYYDVTVQPGATITIEDGGEQ